VTPWLSSEEVADLCEGLTQPAAQLRYLKRTFNIDCRCKPSGAVLVFRHQLEPTAPPVSRPQPNRAALLALVGKQA
jgi:hypothetical protein